MRGKIEKIMRTITYAIFCLSLSWSIFAQEVRIYRPNGAVNRFSDDISSQIQYQNLIQVGNSLRAKKEYRTALNKYNAAKLCDPTKSIEVDKLITAVFDAIEKEKKEAVKLRKSVENEKIALSKLQETNTKNKQLEIEKQNELIRRLKLENEKLEMEKISNLNSELRSNSSLLIKKTILLLEEGKNDEALKILVDLSKKSKIITSGIIENKASFSNNLKLSEPFSLTQERIFDELQLQAELFFLAKDSLNGVKTYGSIIKSDSNNYIGYYGLANYYKRNNNNKEAKKYCQLVLKYTIREDIRGEIYNNLGEINNEFGEIDEALKSFKDAYYCFERMLKISEDYKISFRKTLNNINKLLENNLDEVEKNKWRDILWSVFPEIKVENSLEFSQIKGFVVEQNSGKKPVANVSITANGTNSVRTDANGEFVLTFRESKIGEIVVLRIEKDGWEVVNEKEIKTVIIPTKPNENPVKIVLCKAGTFAIAKSKYYDTFEQNLLKELNRQKALNKGNEKEIARLEEDYAKVQKQLNDLADKYSRINLDDASEIERRANTLFIKGKIDETIKLREDLKSDIILKAIKAEKVADSTITFHSQKLKEIAKAFILNFDYEKAQQTYEKLVFADTTNFDNIYDFAFFFQTQNKLNEAVKWYKKSLYLTKNEDKIANVYNNLGIVYLLQKDFFKSQNMLSKALEIREEVAKNNPIKYDSKLAETQNNLGELFQMGADYDKAKYYHLKALATYEHMLKYNRNSPTNVEAEIAKTQNNLGFLYYTTGEYILAQNAYQYAIDIYKRFDTNNFDISPNLALSFNNLGILYQDKNDYDSASIYFQKALEIREILAKKNPEVYEVEVAIAQNNLGVSYQSIKNYPSALNAYRKAFEIYSRLSKLNPINYEIDYCRSIILLGFLQKEGYKKDSKIINEKDLLTAKQLLLKYSNIPVATLLNEKLKDLELYFSEKE